MSRLIRMARAVGWRLGLVLVSLTITFAIAEVVARLIVSAEVGAFFTPFEHDDSSFTRMVKDPDLLYTLAWYIPGAEGVTGTAPVHINNLGFRDEHDYPVEKPSGCFRVLGLGDSMTFGKGVAAEQTFLAVLEDKLQRRYPQRCIEILNAGMPNTNFHTQWLHYKLQWHTLKPDLIIVAFFAYNDTQTQGEEEPYSLNWMEFIDRNAWLKSSKLVQWAYHRAFFSMGATALEDGLPRYYDDDYPGWIEFRESVGRLQIMSRTHGADLAFVLVPIPEGYDNYPHQSYHDRVARLLTHDFQIPTYDLIRGLGGINARKHWVHPSDGHPDPFVHEQMALYMDEVLPWERWFQAAAERMQQGSDTP